MNSAYRQGQPGTNKAGSFAMEWEDLLKVDICSIVPSDRSWLKQDYLSSVFMIYGIVSQHCYLPQELLGHSQISLTLDTYSHVLPSLVSCNLKADHRQRFL
jgi:hypothetical protein